MEEFLAVVYQKDDLEYRDMSMLKALLSLLAYGDSDSSVGNVVMEKYESEHRHNSEKLQICGIIGLSEIRRKRGNQFGFNHVVHLKSKTWE